MLKKGEIRESAMTDGLILLAFLAVIAAALTVRFRRRLGIASTGRTWLVVIAWAFVLGLVLWVASWPSR
jgi:hypothetical protein